MPRSGSNEQGLDARCLRHTIRQMDVGIARQLNVWKCRHLQVISNCGTQGRAEGRLGVGVSGVQGTSECKGPSSVYLMAV